MQNISGLPPTLEAKRLAVAKAYNKIMLLNLLTVMLLLMTLLLFVRRFGVLADVIFAFGVILPIEVGMIRFAVRRGNDLCSKMNVLCPSCGGPLFQARSTAYLTGTCPKCHARVVPAE